MSIFSTNHNGQNGTAGATCTLAENTPFFDGQKTDIDKKTHSNNKKDKDQQTTSIKN